MNAYNCAHDRNAPPVFLFYFLKLPNLKLLALEIGLLKFLALVYGRSLFKKLLRNFLFVFMFMLRGLIH